MSPLYIWATQESPLRRSFILLHYFIELTEKQAQVSNAKILLLFVRVSRCLAQVYINDWAEGLAAARRHCWSVARTDSHYLLSSTEITTCLSFLAIALTRPDMIIFLMPMTPDQDRSQQQEKAPQAEYRVPAAELHQSADAETSHAPKKSRHHINRARG